MMVVILINSRKRVRKGEELKAFYYASTVASYNDHVTIYNIILNNNKAI